jgi:hypothetical protein
MMSKPFCLLVLFIASCCPQLLHAQYENVWVFGHLITAGTGDKIDFNGSSPAIAPITYSSPGKATASVSDANGQLLFYTEGDTIWSKNSVIMPNGKGLTGLGNAGWGYDATNNTNQGALIVPMPGNSNKYYVFSLTDQSYGSALGAAGYLYYSIVDVSLNNGNGDVVAGQKGIFIDSGFTESMTGVGGNSCNIWITAGGLSTTTGQANVFKSYELTAAGLNTTPVISTVTGPPLISGSGYEGIVKLNFSPNRKKLLRSRLGHPNGLELMDFNAATGIVSNLISIDSGSQTGYLGACFSPDNNKIYATEYGTGVFQFDLNNTTTAAITASKTIVDSAGNSELKYAPDGKIYYFPRSSTQNIYYLKTINAPNAVGLLCLPTISNLTLPFPTSYYSTFPNVIPVILKDTVFNVNHTIVCAQSDSLIHATEINPSGFLWNDGSTDSTLKINHSGTYWVTYHNYCHHITDTLVVELRNIIPVIVRNESILGTTIPYNSYQWYKDGTLITGATGMTYIIAGDGNYTVMVSDDTCTATSMAYNASGTAIADINAIAGKISIYPNPTRNLIYINTPVIVDISITSIEGKQIRTQSNVKSISVADLAEGIYLLHIMDKNGTPLKVEKFIKLK